MKKQRYPFGLSTPVYYLIWVLVGLALPASAAGPEALKFVVMSYNIHHGEGLDGKVDLERIAQLIKTEKADIVALQEMDKGVERTKRRDLPAELAKLTGMTVIFSNNYHFQGGEYGNAVLTRFPVKGATNLHYKMLRPGEQRGLLQLTLNAEGRDLLFWNTHIDYRPEDTERRQNVEEIRKLALQHIGSRIIVCGDFNDVPGSRTHSGMTELFEDAWALVGKGEGFTIPADEPRKRIDYIWIRKETAIKPLRMWVPKTAASDHLPVVAELELR